MVSSIIALLVSCDFYELEEVLKNHKILVKGITVKPPKWFEVFYKEYKNDVVKQQAFNKHIESDISHIKNRLDNIESDIALIKTTPTMRRELK